MGDILQPAIGLAKHGFPVHPVAAHFWNAGCSCLKNPRNKHGSDLLLNGEAPRAGDVMKMPLLASTFEVSILSSRLPNAMLRVTWFRSWRQCYFLCNPSVGTVYQCLDTRRVHKENCTGF